jgi:SpoVK/Ycf46/Vps4 family AAA+-type ATPase
MSISVPTKSADFIATPEFELLVAISGKMLSEGKTANTLLLGPAGCGKTATAEQLAAYLGLPYLHLNCSSIREASMLFGTREVKDGKTYTRASLFTQTIEAGGAVVLLDEINRCAPTALNGLLTAMDGSSPYSEDLERHINVAERIIFIGACNVGAAYTGTFRLDKALDDRFARRLEVSYLPQEKEVQLLTTKTGIGKEAATRLVQIATQVRNEYNRGSRKFSQDISTRILLGAAQDFAALESVKAGAGPRSLQMTLVNRFDNSGDSNSERTSLSMIVDGKFGAWTGEEEEKAAKEAAEKAKAGAVAKKEEPTKEEAPKEGMDIEKPSIDF